MDNAPWIRDVEVESTPLSTTGGYTWKAAFRLADYFAATAADVGLNGKVNILELGSGTGYLGITVARNLPNASIVCLTEQEDGGACDWLRHNVELNKNGGLPLEAVTVQPCDWLKYSPNDGTISKDDELSRKSHNRKKESQELTLEDPENESPSSTSPSSQLDLETISWDFIIGSDLIYNKIGSTCLPRVFAALANPQTQIHYCHTKHRFDLLDLEFFENLTALGLNFEEVWEPGVEAPPNSPPVQFPPLDLFPEQRIAIYKITK
jgi:predicted nicotinamide N-methyase